MKLTIDITRRDYLDFNKHHFIKTRLFRTIITGVVTIAVLQYILSRDGFDLNSCIISSVASAITYFFAVYMSLLYTEKVPKDDGSILGLREFDFMEDEISCKTSTSSSHINWVSIKTIEKGRNAFYLYMDTNMALIIPKRYLKSEKEFNEFEQMVQTKINGSK